MFVRARARVCVCMHVLLSLSLSHTHTHTHTHTQDESMVYPSVNEVCYAGEHSLADFPLDPVDVYFLVG